MKQKKAATTAAVIAALTGGELAFTAKAAAGERSLHGITLAYQRADAAIVSRLQDRREAQKAISAENQQIRDLQFAEDDRRLQVTMESAERDQRLDLLIQFVGLATTVATIVVPKALETPQSSGGGTAAGGGTKALLQEVAPAPKPAGSGPVARGGASRVQPSPASGQNSWPQKVVLWLPEFSQGTTDMVAGVGDVTSLGATRGIREVAGLSGEVDTGSTSYFTGTLMGGLLFGKTVGGLAKTLRLPALLRNR